VRGQPCPIVRTWDELERSIWAGFTCATVNASDTPIHIPTHAEQYDFSRFTIYIRGRMNGPALVDHERAEPAGLQTFAAPRPRRDAVEIATSADGRILEFRSSGFEPNIQAVTRWSQENAALIAERFDRLEAAEDERGSIIRVYLLREESVTSQLPRL
jgi:hypothetical protein